MLVQDLVSKITEPTMANETVNYVEDVHILIENFNSVDACF